MIWEPSPAYIEQTNVWRFMRRLGFTDREAFLRFSREEPERFWDETMREMGVAWFTPYERVLDASRGPEWTQWFLGGRLNIAHNCLDRWADTPERVASRRGTAWPCACRWFRRSSPFCTAAGRPG